MRRVTGQVITADKPGKVAGIHFVVVMFPLRKYPETGVVLCFLQEGAGHFHIKAIVQSKPVAAALIKGRLHSYAALAVFFQWRTGQEVLKKLHVGVADVGGDNKVAVLTAFPLKATVVPKALAVAVGLRVGIFTLSTVVFIGIFAEDIACSFLLEIGRRQQRLHAPHLALIIVAQGKLLLIVAGVVLIAAIVFAVGANPVGVFADRVAVGKFQAAVVMGATFCRNAGFALFAGRATDHVNDAIEGVTAVDGGARPAQYLDASGLFAVDVKQHVYIAEARGSQRDTVFSKIEGAAATRAGKYR